LLSVNKVAVVTATPLYVVGAIAYGPDFDAGFEGSYEEFLPAFIGSTLIVMSNPSLSARSSATGRVTSRPRPRSSS
jgi:hypothetical protein